MTVREVYAEAIIYKHNSLKLLIEYLVHEKQVLKMTDEQDKLTYYLQDKYWAKMGEYLREFESRK